MVFGGFLWGKSMINVGICGVTGYAGYELYRWLTRHPEVHISFTTSESSAGQRLADVYPGPLDAPLIAAAAAPYADVDLVFLCLPHGAASAEALRVRAAGTRAIDFSDDFRLHNAEDYPRWFGREHHAESLLPAIYGLPELHRAALRDATLVANPGCYPTSVLLGVAPLLRAGALRDATLIVDAKSGVSGAGRAPKQNTSFVEVNESLAPYNIGRTHRHIAEMTQQSALLAAGHGPAAHIIFAPHLLPISRGMLSTIYVRVRPDLSEATIRSLYHEAYAAEPFVKLLPASQLATIAHASHTNLCAISLTLAEPGLLIVASAIDNLVKGASGQAIQSMNVMFGLPETTGLL